MKITITHMSSNCCKKLVLFYNISNFWQKLWQMFWTNNEIINKWCRMLVLNTTS